MPNLPAQARIIQPDTIVFAGPSNITRQLGSLRAGSLVQVVGVSRAGTWHAIRWNDRAGWVYGNRTEPLPAAPAGLPERVRISSQHLNLRVGANPDNPGEFLALLHLPRGTELPVLGVNAPGNWYAVEYQDQALWLSAKHVVPAAGDAAEAFADDERPDPGRNIRGVHWAPAVNNAPADRSEWDYWLGELQTLKVGWIKLIDNDNPQDSGILEFAKFWKSHGIEPIIRFFVSHMYPDGLPRDCFSKMEDFAAAGIRWMEIGNEPNIAVEWQDSALAGFPRVRLGDEEVSIISSNEDAIARFSDQWLADAEETLRRGCWPAYPALSPTDWYGGSHPAFSSVEFYRRSFRHFAAEPGRAERLRKAFEAGAWLAVHTSWRRPGELPIDLDPFTTPDAPWDICLRGYEVPVRFLRETAGITGVKVISTEGGAFSPEHLRDHIGDPPYDEDTWFDTLARVHEYLLHHATLLALCPWVLTDGYGASGSWPDNGWYRDKTPRSIVGKLKQARAML